MTLHLQAAPNVKPGSIDSHPQVKAWVYVLLCADRERSTYTGFTTNLIRRIMWHQTGYFKRAYTVDKRPLRLLGAVPMPDRQAALRLERRLKKLTRSQKFAFLLGDREFYDYLATSAANRRRMGRRWRKDGQVPAWYLDERSLEYKATRAAFFLGCTLTGIADLVEQWTGVRPVEGA